MPQQWVPIGLAPMEGMKRTNAGIATLQQRTEFSQRNPYAMDVDRRKNRNYYICGEFRHLVRNCRNRRIGMNRRMEVDQDSNLNGEGGLGSPN